MQQLAAAEVTYWNERGAKEFADSNRIANWYRHDVLSQNRLDMYEYFSHLPSLPRNPTTLELGSGVISIATYLALFHGYQDVTVTDASPTQMALGKSFCGSNSLSDRVRHIAAIFERLPFPNNSFDLIRVHSALHHAADIDVALEESSRCL